MRMRLPVYARLCTTGKLRPERKFDNRGAIGKVEESHMFGYRCHISKPVRRLGCLLSAALLIGFLSRLPFLLGWDQPTHITELQKVKDRTHLTFPPNAVLMDGYEDAFWSCWFIARVRLPRPQVRAFLAQSRWHSAVQDQEIDSHFQDGFSFMRKQHWPVPNPRKFLSTKYEGTSDPASGCSVLVDLDDPRIAIVYIYYYY